MNQSQYFKKIINTEKDEIQKPNTIVEIKRIIKDFNMNFGPNFEKINRFIEGVYQDGHNMYNVMGNRCLDALSFLYACISVLNNDCACVDVDIKEAVQVRYRDYLMDLETIQRLKNEAYETIKKEEKFNLYNIQTMVIYEYETKVKFLLNMYDRKDVIVQFSTLISEKQYKTMRDELGVRNAVLFWHSFENVFRKINDVYPMDKTYVVSDLMNTIESDYWYALFESNNLKKYGMCVETESVLNYIDDYIEMHVFLVNLDKLVQEEEYTLKNISKDDFLHEFGDDLRYLKEFCKKKKKQYILFGRLLNNEEILEKLFKMGFRNFGVFNDQISIFRRVINNYMSRRGKYKGIYAKNLLKKQKREENTQ